MPIRAAQYRTGVLPKPDARPQSHQRGYDHRWRRFRKAFLATHPLCLDCAERGVTEAADEVHHMDRLGPFGPNGYDETNLLPLCKRCHSARTGRGQ
jgi:5-methylcytosine-specific restriction enzyme A